MQTGIQANQNRWDIRFNQFWTPNRSLIQKLHWNVCHDLGNGLYQKWIDLYRKQLWYHFFSGIEMRSTLKLHLTPTMVFHPTYWNNSQYSHHVYIYRCIWCCLILESCLLIKVQDKWGSFSLKNVNKTLQSLLKRCSSIMNIINVLV